MAVSAGVWLIAGCVAAGAGEWVGAVEVGGVREDAAADADGDGEDCDALHAAVVGVSVRRVGGECADEAADGGGSSESAYAAAAAEPGDGFGESVVAVLRAACWFVLVCAGLC